MKETEVGSEPISRSDGDLLVDELAGALLEDEVAPVRLAAFASSEGVDQDPVGILSHV